LASIISMHSLYNPLIEDYAQIFYTIDKEDVSSNQCKMSIKGPKYMREIDVLSLTFIDFYVPVLSPRLSSTETSLQLSENITLFAVCRIYTGVINKEIHIDTRCLGRIIYIVADLLKVSLGVLAPALRNSAVEACCITMCRDRVIPRMT
jgi:hypothetical protein